MDFQSRAVPEKIEKEEEQTEEGPLYRAHHPQRRYHADGFRH